MLNSDIFALQDLIIKLNLKINTESNCIRKIKLIGSFNRNNHCKRTKFKIDRAILTCLNLRAELSVNGGCSVKLALIVEKLGFKKDISRNAKLRAKILPFYVI